MQTPVPKLDPFFREPTDDAPVSGGLVHLTAAEASSIVRTMSFERQRDADKKHIGMLSDMFANGEFAPGSQITFAFDRDGAPRLVDGQHRLRAAIQAEWSGYWDVRVLWGEAHVADGTYVLLDSNQKKRPAGVIGRALGLVQLSKRMQGLCIGAAGQQNMWRTEYTRPQGCSVPPVRDNINRVRERLPQFTAVDDLLSVGNVSAKTKRRVYTARILAIVVETFATAPEEAREFWYGVVTNGGEIPGELRDTMIEGKPPRAGELYMPRIVALVVRNLCNDG